MRGEQTILVVTAVASKRLRLPLSVMQTQQYTEWMHGDVGFAVGRKYAGTITSLIDDITNHFKRHTHASNPSVRPSAPFRR